MTQQQYLQWMATICGDQLPSSASEAALVNWARGKGMNPTGGWQPSAKLTKQVVAQTIVQLLNLAPRKGSFDAVRILEREGITISSTGGFVTLPEFIRLIGDGFGPRVRPHGGSSGGGDDDDGGGSGSSGDDDEGSGGGGDDDNGGGDGDDDGGGGDGDDDGGGGDDDAGGGGGDDDDGPSRDDDDGPRPTPTKPGHGHGDDNDDDGPPGQGNGPKPPKPPKKGDRDDD